MSRGVGSKYFLEASEEFKDDKRPRRLDRIMARALELEEQDIQTEIDLAECDRDPFPAGVRPIWVPRLQRTIDFDHAVVPCLGGYWIHPDEADNEVIDDE